jgi:hypothetical protein
MRDEFSEGKGLCAEYLGVLEELPAKVGRAEGSVELESRLAAAGVAHAKTCAECQELTETFWAARELMAELRTEKPGAPWFAARVMAKIANHEMEMRRERMEWMGEVAKLAARLAWVSAAVLLVASTWVYDGRLRMAAGQTSIDSASASGPQYLFDNSGTTVSSDDVLANLAEKAQ